MTGRILLQFFISSFSFLVLILSRNLSQKIIFHHHYHHLKWIVEQKQFWYRKYVYQVFRLITIVIIRLFLLYYNLLFANWLTSFPSFILALHTRSISACWWVSGGNLVSQKPKSTRKLSSKFKVTSFHDNTRKVIQRNKLSC